MSTPASVPQKLSKLIKKNYEGTFRVSHKCKSTVKDFIELGERSNKRQVESLRCSTNADVFEHVDQLKIGKLCKKRCCPRAKKNMLFPKVTKKMFKKDIFNNSNREIKYGHCKHCKYLSKLTCPEAIMIIYEKI